VVHRLNRTGCLRRATSDMSPSCPGKRSIRPVTSDFQTGVRLGSRTADGPREVDRQTATIPCNPLQRRILGHAIHGQCALRGGWIASADSSSRFQKGASTNAEGECRARLPSSRELNETSGVAALLVRIWRATTNRLTGTFSFRAVATAGVLYGRQDFVASRSDQPQNRLVFSYFSLPCTSVHAPAT